MRQLLGIFGAEPSELCDELLVRETLPLLDVPQEHGVDPELAREALQRPLAPAQRAGAVENFADADEGGVVRGHDAGSQPARSRPPASVVPGSDV